MDWTRDDDWTANNSDEDDEGSQEYADGAAAQAEAEGSQDYYALLNVPKTASTEQIRERYKHLAVLLHPDKHSPEHRDAASVHFRAVQHAYEVLVDDRKRVVYDTLGPRAVDAQWAIGQRLRTPAELRAEYERQRRAQKADELESLVNSRSGVTCTLDARRLFQRSIFADDEELAEELAKIRAEVIVDNAADEDEDLEEDEDELEEEEDSEEEVVKPLITLLRLSLSHFSSIPITPSTAVSFTASGYNRNGKGGGNVLGTVRHHFSNRVIVTAGSNLFIKPVPFVEIETPVPYLRNTGVTILTTYPTLWLPPPVTLNVTRLLSQGWIGQIGWSTGTWTLPFWPPLQVVTMIEEEEDAADTSSKDDATSIEYAPDREGARIELEELEKELNEALPRRAMAAYLAGLDHLQPSFLSLGLSSTALPGRPYRPRRSVTLQLDETKDCRLVTSISFRLPMHRVMMRALEVIGQRPERTEKTVAEEDGSQLHDAVILKFGVGLGLRTGTVISGALEGRSGKVDWGFGVDFGSVGVMLRIKFSRLGQRISLPVLLTTERDVAFAIYAAAIVGVGVIGSVCAAEVASERARIAHKKALREHRVQSLIQKRKEAEEVTEMLREQVKRTLAAEQASNGLVILEAIYGPTELLKGARSRGAEPLNVTVQVQALVTNSQLQISGGHSKAGLLGFYDAFPGQRKSLLIKYEFRGRQQEVLVSDTEGVTVPSNAHAS